MSYIDYLKNVKANFSEIWTFWTVLVPAGDISNGKYLHTQPS